MIQDAGTDSLWYEESNDQYNALESTREAEWNKLSSEYTNAGYREGITAGKESSVQEGFDAGFALIGAPLGRELGLIRGRASAILAFLTSPVQSASLSIPSDEKDVFLNEAREINARLGQVRFSDIEPRDEEADRHATEHLEAEGEEMEGLEMLQERQSMERVEDMLAGLGLGIGDSERLKPRPTMNDVRTLSDRLQALCLKIGLV